MNVKYPITVAEMARIISEAADRAKMRQPQAFNPFPYGTSKENWDRYYKMLDEVFAEQVRTNDIRIQNVKEKIPKYPRKPLLNNKTLDEINEDIKVFIADKKNSKPCPATHPFNGNPVFNLDYFTNGRPYRKTY